MSEVVKIKFELKFVSKGVRRYQAGFHFLPFDKEETDTIIVVWPGSTLKKLPVGCVRISDIQAEELGLTNAD